MVVYIVHLLEFGIGCSESVELLLTQAEVVELVLENDAGVVKSVGDDGVASFFLFLGEGDVL